jgi:hypothetical protein
MRETLMRKAISAVASLAVVPVLATGGTAAASTTGEVSSTSTCYSVAKVNTPIYYGKTVNTTKLGTFKKGTSQTAHCGGYTGGSHTACGATNKYWIYLPNAAGGTGGYVMWGCVTLQTDT